MDHVWWLEEVRERNKEARMAGSGSGGKYGRVGGLVGVRHGGL